MHAVDCISYFLHYCDKMLDKKQLKRERNYFGSQLEDIVHPDGEGVSSGGSRQSLCGCSIRLLVHISINQDVKTCQEVGLGYKTLKPVPRPNSSK